MSFDSRIFFFLICWITFFFKLSVWCYIRGTKILPIKWGHLHGISEYYLHLALTQQIKILIYMGEISFFLGSLKSFHREKKGRPLMTSHHLEVQKTWLPLTALQLVTPAQSFPGLGGQLRRRHAWEVGLVWNHVSLLLWNLSCFKLSFSLELWYPLLWVTLSSLVVIRCNLTFITFFAYRVMQKKCVVTGIA